MLHSYVTFSPARLVRLLTWVLWVGNSPAKDKTRTIKYFFNPYIPKENSENKHNIVLARYIHR